MTGALDYQLPPSLAKVPAIRRIYPDLYARATGPRINERGRPVSWNRLRRQARTRWVRQHPAAPAAITAYVRWGGSIRVAFHRVWDAYGIPAWRQARLDCFVEHEGGYDRMDRWFGPGLDLHGWMDGRFAGTDRVLGPGQVRPYHARLTHPEVRDDVVSERTFAILTNPFDHARTMYLVGDHAYATLGVCS